MQQLELFDYRSDYIFDSNNQIAHYYDVLKESRDTISYSEHIDPNKGYAVCGMEYEEYVDVKKNELNVRTLPLYNLKIFFYIYLRNLCVGKTFPITGINTLGNRY